MARHTGTPMGAQRLGQGAFSSLLWRMAQKLPPTERVLHVDGKAVRSAAVAAHCKKADLTDAQVVECRRIYESKEKTCRQLAEMHGVTYARMHHILDYQTRTFGL